MASQWLNGKKFVLSMTLPTKRASRAIAATKKKLLLVKDQSNLESKNVGWVIAIIVALYFLFVRGGTVSSAPGGIAFIPEHPTTFNSSNVDNPQPPGATFAPLPTPGVSPSAPVVTAQPLPVIRSVTPTPPIRIATEAPVTQAPPTGARGVTSGQSPSLVLYNIFGGKTRPTY